MVSLIQFCAKSSLRSVRNLCRMTAKQTLTSVCVNVTTSTIAGCGVCWMCSEKCKHCGVMISCLSAVVAEAQTHLQAALEHLSAACHRSVAAQWLTDCVLWLDPGLGMWARWLANTQKDTFSIFFFFTIGWKNYFKSEVSTLQFLFNYFFFCSRTDFSDNHNIWWI